jgi:CheY-like chemotaxis protein
MTEMRLLIVDDSAQMRRAVRSLLSDLVEEVYEARDGKEALATWRAYRPEWVLMDVRMRGMDGISATRLLKTSFPEAKVFIITSYDDPGLREAAAAAGAFAFVLKDNLLALRRILSVAREETRHD